MKSAIIIFLIAMAISPLLNDEVPKYPYKPGVMNVGTASPSPGMRKQECTIPEMQVVDGYRNVGIMTGATDTSENTSFEFPMQAIQQ
jgi:hypothetical protein